MKSSVFALCLLAATFGTAGAAATRSPVERVVKLLEDLKTKLTADEASEQKVYDKYACWCETTSARKAGAITDATNELRMLGQQILKLKGLIATRAAEIDELAADIKSNLEEQASATSIRSKENADYTAETTETKEALAALEKAVNVLVEGTSSASLLQSQTKGTQAVKDFMQKVPSRVGLKADQAVMLQEFLGSAGSAKYAPQSDTVQGMLKDMYETMSANLESATSTEAKQNRDFEDFIAVKETERKEAEASKKQKEAEKAEAELKLADTQAIYDDTLATKNADIAFFDATKESCSTKSEEWNLRSSLREEEIEGVDKALEILTSDEARALFASAIKPGKEVGASSSGKSSGVDISLLQLGSEAQPVMKAYGLLKAQATKLHSLRLAAIAMSVRTAKAGHFDKVIGAINDMVQVLKDEGASDIAKRDQCKDEYKNTESTMKDLSWKIEKNDAKIDKLQALIELRKEQKEKTIEEMNSVKDQMSQMTDERKAENAAFKFAKQEDTDAIELLTSARDALTAFYKKNDVKMGEIQGSVKGAFVQEPEFAVSEDQAPDASFSGKGKRKNESKGITSILTMIIEDLDDEIKNGMKAEEESQLEFEKMLDAAQKYWEELDAKKTALTNAIAQRSSEKSDEIADKEKNNADLTDEQDYRKEITPDCDWIIGAFAKRAEARAAEIQGLTGAKEMLSGMVPAELVQKQATLGGIKFLGLRK